MRVRLKISSRNLHLNTIFKGRIFSPPTKHTEWVFKFSGKTTTSIKLSIHKLFIDIFTDISIYISDYY